MELLFLIFSRPLFPYFSFDSIKQECECFGSEQKLILQSNDEYIQEIRHRLMENKMAYERRKRRIDQFLVDQLKVIEAQQVKLQILLNMT